MKKFKKIIVSLFMLSVLLYGFWNLYFDFNAGGGINYYRESPKKVLLVVGIAFLLGAIIWLFNKLEHSKQAKSTAVLWGGVSSIVTVGFALYFHVITKAFFQIQAYNDLLTYSGSLNLDKYRYAFFIIIFIMISIVFICWRKFLMCVKVLDDNVL